MLKALRIANLAIIDDVFLEFPPGFTVMTGETGAGKSILIDGLSLALGERADRDMIRTGCSEARVEALFEIGGLAEVAGLLADLDIPVEGQELLLRRVVSSSGKGRCSANNSPLPLADLKRIGDLLVDLHGQHDHQLLLSEKSHLRFLDGFGKLLPACAELRDLFLNWQERGKQLARLLEARKEKTQRLDMLAFQANEISAARVAAGEDAVLAAEKSRLANVQKIAQALSTAREALQGEGGASESVGAAFAALKAAAEFDQEAMAERMASLNAILESLQDRGGEMREALEALVADPARLETVEERLDLLARLKRKYGGTLEGVLEHLKKVSEELAELGGVEEKTAEMEKELEEARKALGKAAQGLSAKRAAAAKEFSSQVKKEFRLLAMGEAGFGIKQERREDEAGPANIEGKNYAVTEEGLDLVEFLFTPNVGEGTRPLKDIASGGELSRIMLALKSVLAEVDRVGTLVFDEIDSGIGGRVAEVVGRKLEAIGRERQVICITHLPQIAARAGSHIVVRKRTSKGHTAMQAGPAQGEERIAELARMLAGEEIAESALKHARHLLKRQ